MRIIETLIYLAKRLLMAVFVLLLVSLIVFITVRLTPGDPVLNKIGPYGDTSPENYQRVSQELGLDQPFAIQYAHWVRSCLRLDLGVSLRSGIAVAETIRQKLPVSLELIAASLLFATVLAVPLGMWAAAKKGGVADQIISVLSTGFLAIPAFSIGLLMISLFAVQWKLFPSGGYVSFAEDPAGNLRHLFLPALTLGLYEMAIICRHVRSQALDVLSSNYIRTARSKGLSRRSVYFVHALRNILITLVTVIGTEFASLFGSTVICEQVFGWSGLGWYIYQSVVNRDYPAVQASVLAVAVIFVGINLLMDILYTLIDPRVKLN